MERIWADTSGQDSYDAYTCAVSSALFLECLDIAGARTLGNSLSDATAYNVSGSSGNLNSNFYAVLALEGLLNMTGANASSNYFGADVSCYGKVVGDGAVNAYDIAALMWYQFKFEPYDLLPNDPSVVATVQGRDDTAYRCNIGETRRMWNMAVGETYCHRGQSAADLGYVSSRRLSSEVLTQPNLYASIGSMPRSRLPRVAHEPMGSLETSLDAREMRKPDARRSSVIRDDMIRNVDSMLSLDIDVFEWAHVEGQGRWIRFRAPGVQVAVELYLAGIAVDNPIHLSLQRAPEKNCTTCVPVDDDPNQVVIAFARRAEYESQHFSSLQRSHTDICASIVSATLQSTVMIGNTIALRQQPPTRACAFDIFMWVPENPAEGIHISRSSLPYSFSARRLAAVGAESTVAKATTGCNNDIGVLAGSSALDGFRGKVQRGSSCTRYDSEPIELITPPSPPSEQCPSDCNSNAPALNVLLSRSFQTTVSDELMHRIYQNSINLMQSIGLSSHGYAGDYALVHSSSGTSAYARFETLLARESHSNACCAGFTCIAQNGSGSGSNYTQGTCEVGQPLPPLPPGVPPSQPPLQPPQSPRPPQPPQPPTSPDNNNDTSIVVGVGAGFFVTLSCVCCFLLFGCARKDKKECKDEEETLLNCKEKNKEQEKKSGSDSASPSVSVVKRATAGSANLHSRRFFHLDMRKNAPPLRP